MTLCDGTINFDEDQGRDQKFNGTGTKAGFRNVMGLGLGLGPITGTRTKNKTITSNKTKPIKIALIIFFYLKLQ